MKQFLSSFFLFIFLGSLPFASFSQGKFMLVGGGSETDGGWSDAPYQWAVQQSANKRVAIISTAAGTTWLPNYFVKLGATSAKNFLLASVALADAQPTYDSLMAYDVLFFKGGDQSEYYTYYKGTKTEDAIRNKFLAGGVLAGTSAGAMMLSGVMYTAMNGSILPSQALANVDDSRMSLASDFVDVAPQYLFDTHVVERGRFGRTAAFLAKWTLDTGTSPITVGMDDKTALCIDAAGLGVVRGGTAAANIYANTLGSTGFKRSGTKPVIDSLRVTQLLQGDSIDFTTLKASGLQTLTVPAIAQETRNATILLSGNNSPTMSASALQQLAQNGALSDTIVLICNTGTGNVTTIAQNLTALGAPVQVVALSMAVQSSASAAYSQIYRSRKFLFAENNASLCVSFLNGGPLGSLLVGRLMASNTVTAFIGDDSRLAGAWYVDNYTTATASYDGALNFQSGIGLLQTSIIQPNTYVNTNYYENTSSGVPFAMVTKGLAYGIFLDGDVVARYYVQGDTSFVVSQGSIPLLILRNTGTLTDVAGLFSGYSRNVAGFEKMTLSLMDNTPYRLGTGIQTAMEEEMPAATGGIGLWPNPAQDNLYVSLPAGYDAQHAMRYTLCNMAGATVQEAAWNGDAIDVSALPAGYYLLQITDGTQRWTKPVAVQ